MHKFNAQKAKEAIEIIRNMPFKEPEYMIFAFEGKLYEKNKNEVWEIEKDGENIYYIKKIK